MNPFFKDFHRASHFRFLYSSKICRSFNQYCILNGIVRRNFSKKKSRSIRGLLIRGVDAQEVRRPEGFKCFRKFNGKMTIFPPLFFDFWEVLMITFRFIQKFKKMYSNFSTKFAHIFRKIACMHLYGTGGGAPEASEFIKSQMINQQKSSIFKGNFIRYEHFLICRSQLKLALR